MNQMIAPERLPLEPAPRAARMTFAGQNKDFRKLVTRGALLELVTFGFYRFWLATAMRRYLWTSTAVEGDALEYTGRGRELFIGFLFAMAILMPVYVGYFLLGLEAERLRAFGSLPLAVFLYGFSQFAIYRARRYRLTRTVWRGVRFWMTGSGFSYALRSFGWAFLAIITLGLAYPWRAAALERYKMRHTFYGDLQGGFDGLGWTFFKRGFWVWAAALATVAGFVGGIVAIAFGSMAVKQSSVSMHAIGEIGGGIAILVTCAIVSLFVYPAFQAIEWKWWLQNVRFGDLRAESDLRTRPLIGNFWKLVGIALLIVIAGSGAIVGGLAAVGDRMPFNPMVPVTVAFYLAMILSLGVVKRIYMTQRVWKIVVTSVTLHGLDVTDAIVGKGELANAVGEGLADGLDVAGF